MTAARLRQADHSPLLRTDFTDDGAWQALLDMVGEDGVTVMADPNHRDLSVSELTAQVPDGRQNAVLAVADRVTFSSDESDERSQPAEPGRSARLHPWTGNFTPALDRTEPAR